jgi:hypothetical protein
VKNVFTFMLSLFDEALKEEHRLRTWRFVSCTAHKKTKNNEMGEAMWYVWKI